MSAAWKMHSDRRRDDDHVENSSASAHLIEAMKVLKVMDVLARFRGPMAARNCRCMTRDMHRAAVALRLAAAGGSDRDMLPVTCMAQQQ